MYTMIDLHFNAITSNHERREEQDIQKGVVKRKNNNARYMSLCVYVANTEK